MITLPAIIIGIIDMLIQKAVKSDKIRDTAQQARNLLIKAAPGVEPVTDADIIDMMEQRFRKNFEENQAEIVKLREQIASAPTLPVAPGG